MKKFIASAILVVTTLFICVGIYNFPKGNNPIFSSGGIDIAEVVHRFSANHSKYDYEWTNKRYKNTPEKISSEKNSEWKIPIGPGKVIPKEKCNCSCLEENYVPWVKYPKEMHPKWESWDTTRNDEKQPEKKSQTNSSWESWDSMWGDKKSQ